MKYYKTKSHEGYIMMIGTASGNAELGENEISAAQYEALMEAIKNAPHSAPDAETGRFESYIVEDGNGGYEYVRHDLPDLPPEDEREISAEKALEIITGGCESNG